MESNEHNKNNKNNRNKKQKKKIEILFSKIIVATSIIFSGFFKIPKACATDSNFNDKNTEIIYVEKIPIKIKLGKNSVHSIIELEIDNSNATDVYKKGIFMNKKKITTVIVEPSSFIEVDKKTYFPNKKSNLTKPMDIISVNQKIVDIILKNEIEDREEYYNEIILNPFTKHIKLQFGVNCSLTESNIQVYKKKADKLIKDNLLLIPDKDKKF